MYSMNEILHENNIRQAMNLSTRSGLWVSKSYDPKIDMPNPRPFIVSDLDLVIKLCDVIDFVKGGYKEEIYRNLFHKSPFYIRILCGLERCLKKEDIIKIDINKYRRPFDFIKEGKEVNLLELAESGEFFGRLNEIAKQSLPHRDFPQLPEDFGRY